MISGIANLINSGKLTRLDLMDSVFKNWRGTKWPDHLIPNIPVFDIDNVVRFVATHNNPKDLTQLISGLPNLAPPFPSFLMEYKTEAYQESALWSNHTDWAKFERIGIWFTSKETEDNGWTLFPMLYFQGKGLKVIEGPTYGLGLDVGSDGSWDGINYYNPITYQRSESKTLPEITHDLTALWLPLFVPALVAVSFLHCKNVEVKANVPSRTLQAMRKKGEKPLLTFHTLEITPLKRILETEGNLNQTGLKQALHICRGHFKDFRERGLFGLDTHKGIYWWGPQVRGSASEGIREKDYKSNPPK